MLGRAGGLTVLQSKGDRYSVLQGDKLRFGTVETTISYSTTFRQVSVTALVPIAVCQQAYTALCSFGNWLALLPEHMSRNRATSGLCANRPLAVGRHSWKWSARL